MNWLMDDERTGSRPHAVVRRIPPERTAAHFYSLMIEFVVILATAGRDSQINQSIGWMITSSDSSIIQSVATSICN